MDESSYYSDYTRIEDVSDRQRSSIIKVRFNKWERGCRFPKTGIMKLFYKQKEAYVKEANFLKMVTSFHPNTVKYYHDQIIGKFYCIFMELCKNGSIASQIQNRRNWSIKSKVRISSEIVEALSVLHQKEIAHRDIKPDNILLTGKDEIRLADFDFMKEIRVNPSPHTVGGTVEYMSPFLRKLHKMGIEREERIDPFKEDAWSTGKTLYEIFTYNSPNSLLEEYEYNKAAISEAELENNVKKRAELEMINCGVQREVIEIIKDMLAFNAENRIKMLEASKRFKNLPPANEETKSISDPSCTAEIATKKVVEAKYFLLPSSYEGKTDSQNAQKALEFVSASNLSSFCASSNNPQVSEENKSSQASEVFDDCNLEINRMNISNIKSTTLETEENKFFNLESIKNIYQTSSRNSESLENAENEETKMLYKKGECMKLPSIERKENFENSNPEIEKNNICINEAQLSFEVANYKKSCEICRNELNMLCEQCWDVDLITSFIKEKIDIGCKYSEITCIGCENHFPKNIFECRLKHFGILPDDFF
ncbi:unnamed protein product [Blepharisma stoltei]|uniref:Protein kinase domain-containing protein n=1 Tax=Blepharisma stoltei TaxID=1481888 RepID=A0AAU9JMJ4_9CILI|nr:unnamed protein product [Blepharisma stoltei]